MGKKGQIELTFNWIYIAIAGAIILLFFIGIVVKQSKVSEEQLSVDVVRILDTIFTGAGVSEKTKNIIPAKGLADYILYFDCNEGVSEFGIKNQPARRQNSIDPLFAPREIQSNQIITLSLPYRLPFKIIDFLYVTSYNTKYVLIGGTPDFVEEFLNETEGFNREYHDELSGLKIDGDIQIRIIDAEGNQVPGKNVPAGLVNFADKDVSAVVFPDGGERVDFYQKERGFWKKLNKEPMDIISLDKEKDAAKYAAIFSQDDRMYRCNMKKAFKRLEYLTEVYGGNDISKSKVDGKLLKMINFYKGGSSSQCLALLTGFKENVKDTLIALNNYAVGCSVELETEENPVSCTELLPEADTLRKINRELRSNCATLY